MKKQTNLIDRHVGKRVSALRRAAGLPADNAATLIGVSLDDYRKLESGKERFQAQQLLALAFNFGVSSSIFFDGLQLTHSSFCRPKEKGSLSDFVLVRRLVRTQTQKKWLYPDIGLEQTQTLN